MRFMLLVFLKGYETAVPEAVPDAKTVAKMMEYNRSLQKAGVLLGLDGLLPPSTGARVGYTDGKAAVTDGPFAEAKEIVGGYWIIHVRSREEAIGWAKRAPRPTTRSSKCAKSTRWAIFPLMCRKQPKASRSSRTRLPSRHERHRQNGHSQND